MLPATLLSSLLISSALALPLSPAPPERPAHNIINVGSYDKNYYKNQKKYYKSQNKYDNRYYYHGRYWGHRYYARPPGWQTLGCFAAGPVWYCP